MHSGQDLKNIFIKCCRVISIFHSKRFYTTKITCMWFEKHCCFGNDNLKCYFIGHIYDTLSCQFVSIFVSTIVSDFMCDTAIQSRLHLAQIESHHCWCTSKRMENEECTTGGPHPLIGHCQWSRLQESFQWRQWDSHGGQWMADGWWSFN